MIRVLTIKPKAMKKKTGSNFIREICVAGACIDITLKYSIKSGRGQRAAKSNPSREAVIRNNDKIAVKELARLLNSNFHPGDWHATLTYEGDEPSQKEAKKELRNFIRRMGREYAKAKREFRWIAVTEYKNHRIHHHVVMSYIESSVINEQWKRGYVKYSALDRSRNYRKLAEYLVKETTKTMREPGNETKRRWTSSRNLVRPIIKREIVHPSAMFEQPKAFKGYEIDQDTIHRYEHPFTGIEHLEYMMVSSDPVPRLKSWRKGKAIDRQETMKRAEEIQISMDTLDGWSFV